METKDKYFFTGYATSLVLKNMTIINAKADFGGALSNYGTLKIINSTLVNNTANNEGGAIYNAGPMTIIQSTLANNTATNEGGAIKNYGTLTITDSTLINNTAYNDGGAIENDGTLNIINSTLVDNTAYRDGGAIENDGPLNIIESTLANNTATNNGGAFSHHITDYYNIVASNITGNHALNGGAIYSLGAANLTGNIFTNNTADNRETIDLYGYWNGQFNSNTYKTTDISLNNILSIKDDKESFVYGEDVVLNFNIELEHPYYYDKDVIDQIDKAIYINGEKNVTTKCENYTLSNLNIGQYTIYYTNSNQKSNNVTFKVIGESQITTPENSYDYQEGIPDTITLNIIDPSGLKGTAKITVKDASGYKQLLNLTDVTDGYEVSTESIVNALETIYDNLDDSYTINITYSNDYIMSSST